jgi:hypothetical protein
MLGITEVAQNSSIALPILVYLCFCWVSYLAYPNLLGKKALMLLWLYSMQRKHYKIMGQFFLLRYLFSKIRIVASD